MKKDGKHVLVIDDDEPHLFLVSNILEGAGYTVEKCRDANSGLDAIEKNTPHLIILDLILPGLSGFEFLEMKRNDPRISEIPVLVLSVIIDKKSVFEAISLGAQDYLIKPFESSRLIQKVVKHLQDSPSSGIKFDRQDRPSVRARIPGRILTINEVEFLLEAPVNLSPEVQVHIHAPLTDHLGCSNCVFQRTAKPAKIVLSGSYTHEVAIIGLDASGTREMLKILRGWK